MNLAESVLNERVQSLLARFGASVCGTELVCDGDFCGHITASARVYNLDSTKVLQVWSAKNQKWQLPGAHGESALDLEHIAHHAALKALGLPLSARLEGGQMVAVQPEEIPEYWNTPAHRHLALVFEFRASEQEPLPRGARWFGLRE